MADSINEWANDDSSESQATKSVFSDSEESTVPPRSLLRPAGSALLFVPYADWKPELTYDHQPPIHICYTLDWTLSVNNRQRSGETELGIVISPQKFWKHVLRPKLQAALENLPRACTETQTRLILFVTDKKTKKITRRFPKLEIKWAEVAKHLQEWSRFLLDGKKLTIEATFYFSEESGKKVPAARGATATQLAERGSRVEAEIGVLGRAECWRRVYALMRCPGEPCTKGPHCWQNEGKHYRLMSHHLKMLVDRVQQGHDLKTHDDVPDDFCRQLQAEEQERTSQQQRKRRRHNPDEPPANLFTSTLETRTQLSATLLLRTWYSRQRLS